MEVHDRHKLVDLVQVRRSRKFVITAALTLCLLFALLAVWHARAGSSVEAGLVHPDAGHLPYVAVAPVKRETIANSLSIAGQFIPYQNVDLHAKVAGYIRTINVDIGDHVHKGQVLAVLEIPELVAEVDEAQASVHHAEEEIQRSHSDVSRAEADCVALHANADRLINTAKARPGLIAEQELDDAIAKDRASQAQVDAAKSARAAAKQQLAVAEANRQHYMALSDYAKITAPYDGVVTWRFSDTGSLVQAGTSTNSGLPVVTLAQIDVLRLRIPVPESLASKVRSGDTADVRVQATGEHFSGKVARFTNSLDSSTRTMQVEIDVPNPHYQLQPGMYAEVVLKAENHPNTLTVPVEAVKHHDGKASVLIVDAQNRVELREIRSGLEDPDRVEVIAGLAEGDRVIVGDSGSLQPGQMVAPRPTKVMAVTGESGGQQ